MAKNTDTTILSTIPADVTVEDLLESTSPEDIERLFFAVARKYGFGGWGPDHDIEFDCMPEDVTKELERVAYGAPEVRWEKALLMLAARWEWDCMTAELED